jgi:ABC-type branched-subunit amino acid transport system substrate-binding protein
MKLSYVGATLAASLVVLAGCGGGDSDSDSGAGSESGSLKVMVIGGFESETLSVPQLVDGAEAAAKAINADGGINGKDLEVLTCNTREDENQAAKCARDAVSEGVFAAVGASTTKSAATLPVLEQAGIAAIPAFPITTEDFNSPVTFPISGGSLEYGGAAALLEQEKGIKNIGFVVRDAASADTGIAFAKGAVGGDVKFTKEARIPAAGAGDVAPQIAAAANGTDAIITVTNQPQLGSVLRQIAQDGSKVLVASNDAGLPEELISELGDAAEGFLAAGSAPPILSDNPAAVQFQEEMKANGSAEKADALSFLSWTATHLAAQVAGDLDEVDNKSFLDAMNGLDGLDYLWLQDFTTKPIDLEGYTRLFNRKVYFSEVKDGVKTLLKPEPVEIAVG